MIEKRNLGRRYEIILTGFGGQGIVLAGKILGQAAAIGDGRESTLAQSYGPEARGGACSAQVIISDTPIYYPPVRRADILVCMSQAGLEKYLGMLVEGGVLIIDQDLVKPKNFQGEYFSIPSTRIAEELGRKMMANIIILGFMVSLTDVVKPESARASVAASVPRGTAEKNILAFNKGYDYGLAVLKGRQKKAAGIGGAAS